MSKIGYARVSTKEQNLDLQIDYLKNHGVEDGLIFIDKGVSGAVAPEQRDGFKQLLQKARSGDTLVVYKLDRISRKYDDVQDVIKTLKDMGLNFEIGGLPNINTGNKLMDKALTDMLLNLLKSKVALKASLRNTAHIQKISTDVIFTIKLLKI